MFYFLLFKNIAIEIARAAGINARANAMDDVTIDDLLQEPSIAFCVGTAGQGEFPLNARKLWAQIKVCLFFLKKCIKRML